MTQRRLLTIPISHFCEKARWALERAGLAYREERHVQGVNRVVSKRAGGHGTLPVLVCEIGVAQDRLGLREHADLADQHGQRAVPAGAPRHDPVDALHVAIFAVGQPGALERPAGLLAEVADRDREQAAGGHRVSGRNSSTSTSGGANSRTGRPLVPSPAPT